MDVTRTLPSHFEKLYFSVLRAVVSTSEPMKLEIAAGTTHDKNGNHKNLYDCYYFYHWVNNVPFLHRDKFLGELESIGINERAWTNKASTLGVTKTIFAQKAFELSAQLNESTVQQHLYGYIKSSRRSGASLFGIKGHEEVVEALLNETPLTPVQRRLYDELINDCHPRLQPREQEIIGRDEEIARIVSFLNSREKAAYVDGLAGIGKTEVCKAALKKWLGSNNATRAFWVQVSDNADAPRFIEHLAEAIGLTPETKVSTPELYQLRSFLPEAVYYLDNIESVAESSSGKRLISDLCNVPGVRVLASSRVPLDGIIRNGFHVRRLSANDGARLFLECWSGSSPEDTSDVRYFVDAQLGGHPLCIVLLARLGRAYGFESLKLVWNKQGTLLATARKPGGRSDSLGVSFSLTKAILAAIPGALDLWQFVALFPDGCDEDSINVWESITEHYQARVALAEYYLLSVDQCHITMLPPVARYALGSSGIEDSSEQGFSWNTARDHAYNYFIKLSCDASECDGSEVEIDRRIKASGQLRSVERLIRTDIASGAPNIKLLRTLHYQLRDAYTFNAPVGRVVAGLTLQLLDDALSNHVIGYLEHQLGNFVKARNFYVQAIDLYEKEAHPLGLANTHHSLGTLEQADGNYEQARNHYQRAAELYQNKASQSGLAHVSHALGTLEHLLGNAERARQHYNQAIDLCKTDMDQLGLANAFHSLGDLERLSGCSEQARVHYEQALELYNREESLLGRANTFLSLGELYLYSNHEEQARKHYSEAVKLFQECQNQLGLANSLRALGDLDSELKDFVSARNTYKEAFLIYQQIEDRLGLAHTFRSMGCLESQLDRSDEARSQYEHALKIYEKMEYDLGLAKTFLLMGNLELRIDRVEEARSFLKRSVEIYRKASDQEGLSNALSALNALETK